MKFIWGALMLTLAGWAVAAGADEAKDLKPVKIPGRQAAPEFTDIEAWVNSPPLKMAALKGKVVVVHFLAFG